jgi:hypothetical protein
MLQIRVVGYCRRITSMSPILQQIRSLVGRSKVRISMHAYDELVADELTIREVLTRLGDTEEIEEYPDFPRGPCVLVLQYDKMGEPIHVLWGIPAGFSEPAVVVTVYRPETDRWSSDFKRRKR